MSGPRSTQLFESFLPGWNTIDRAVSFDKRNIWTLGERYAAYCKSFRLF